MSVKKTPAGRWRLFDDGLETELHPGQKAKTPRGAKRPRPPKKMGGGGGRARLERTVHKAPEVMVKISGGGKNMRRIKAHFDYISRNGAVELEDETGMAHLGREAVRDVRDAWAYGHYGIPEEGERRKEAFHIVLSMPPGTDRQAVTDAAREFAQSQFSTHQYVFATHSDEKHPHVHLAVKATDREGVRLNPRKADLQRWRELFAEKLREQGIAANATPRQARGVVRKAEKQAVRNIRRRGGKSRAYSGQVAEAAQEARGGQRKENPAQERIEASRKAVTRMYGRLARDLVKGEDDDRALALQIVRFVESMPAPVTRHAAMVQALQQDAPKTAARERARPNEPDRDGGKDK